MLLIIGLCDLLSSDVLWGSNLQTIKRLVPFFNLSFKKNLAALSITFFVGLTNLSSSLIVKRNRNTFEMHCHGQFSSCTALHCKEKSTWRCLWWFENGVLLSDFIIMITYVSLSIAFRFIVYALKINCGNPQCKYNISYKFLILDFFSLIGKL